MCFLQGVESTGKDGQQQRAVRAAKRSRKRNSAPCPGIQCGAGAGVWRDAPTGTRAVAVTFRLTRKGAGDSGYTATNQSSPEGGSESCEPEAFEWDEVEAPSTHSPGRAAITKVPCGGINECLRVNNASHGAACVNCMGPGEKTRGLLGATPE